MLNSLIKFFDKFAVATKWMNNIGAFVCFAMAIATTVNVVARYVFNSPIKGIFEYTAASLVIVVYFGVAYTQHVKEHVAVDLFTQKLNDKWRVASDFCNTILCIVIAILCVVAGIKETEYFIENNVSTNHNFMLAAAPFGVIIVIGTVALTITYIGDLVRILKRGRDANCKAYHWIVGIIVPLAIGAIAAILIFADINYNITAMGIIGIVVSLIFMFMGIPISMSFIMAAVIFISALKNTATMMSMLSQVLFTQTSSNSWTVFPFFLLMGYLCFEFDYGKDLYEMAYKLVGRFPGGLAVATVTACAAFAAIVGNGTAPCVTMGSVALPEMDKYKYNRELSSGTIIGGCSLGPIIPPSQPLIIYAMLAQLSVGTLFIASLIPGIVLWLIFSIYIIIRCKIHPEDGPKGEKFCGKEKLNGIKKGIPALIIFLVVIVGIFVGAFSATEAGAIGCVLILIIAIIQRRLKWDKLCNALIETGKASAMIFMIIIGASLLGKIITLAKLPSMLTSVVSSSAISPTVAAILILLIFFALGFFVDIMPLMLIGIPVVHPALTALGFNPIWLAVILTITICSGTITPPVGINLFTLKGVRKDMPIETIFKGAIPFVVLTLVLIVILFAFPDLITWLPNVLKK